MCFQGNSASLSSTYVKHQLAALWENAKSCALDTTKGGAPTGINAPVKSAYTRALYEYQYPSVSQSPSFQTTFDQPELTFLCDHEAILSLKPFMRSTAPAMNGAATQASSQLVFRYRVPFERTSVKDRSFGIDGNAPVHTIRMLTLKLEEATLIGSMMDQEQATTRSHLRRYLGFLQESGHHIFFDLPEFAAREKVSLTDYALACDDTKLDQYSKGVSVLGTPIDRIDSFLETQWAAARNLASEKRDGLAASIAVFDTRWLLNRPAHTLCHARIEFNAPEIKALCSREVVLCFKVRRVAVFSSAAFSDDPPLILDDLTIAFVMNVMKYDSKIGILELDFSTARYIPGISPSAKKEHPQFPSLVALLSTEYLDALLSYSYHVIYRPSIHTATSSVGSEYWQPIHQVGNDYRPRSHGRTLIWFERIRDISLSACDQVVTLSEDAINFYFRSLQIRSGQDHPLSRWTNDKFTATFNPITIRLLTNRKVIVTQNKMVHTSLSDHFWNDKVTGTSQVVGSSLQWYNFDSVTLQRWLFPNHHLRV
ncbi:hypothetical protein PsYK624_146360 [Phanerochaete sordida]|uniref:Uncharacterized protein n=1 Tax=Phanerochaete sordida TaxID=48140 RepID=A0A9P3GNT1_9APHY|nr:hypothetical protein PsYK624_146360 [Phanerochaete sordida]